MTPEVDPPTIAPHAYVSIEGIAECFACGEGQLHTLHSGHDPRPNDLIGALGAAVKRAGLTMTLHGKPIEVDELRVAAIESAIDRIAAAATGNRHGNLDSIPRCSNTNAEDVCMYAGPCLECSSNRDKERARSEKLAKLKLGAVVHVHGFSKGEERAHVVVAEPREGRVKLVYCATERWYAAKWYAVEFVITDVDERNAHVRRARRWLAKVQPGADGWKRILVDRYGSEETETVGHVTLGGESPWGGV